ncbi:MAG TPA: amidohydrolase family protein [Candidatus Choladousia intestinigallinarum]|nr:amidohydrolase family protein [Candidatus Choladousia intestinigallinarum]
MFGECHAHMIMDGVNYSHAVSLHKNGVRDDLLLEKFRCYAQKGITFIRDGGDALGVSARAAALAPEFGMDYRTPLFAIHKNGHYGGIVGLGFDTMKEYAALVRRVRQEGGDFIKVMFSGIMDFAGDGGVNQEPLARDEIREMIHIAHEEGFAVMAHVNGARPILHAIEAGVDSVEHGNFMDEDCLQALAESRSVWVPTLVTIANLIGCGRFKDPVLLRLKELQSSRIRRAFELGALVALGSDAGAFEVFHGQGLLDEYAQFRLILGEDCREDFPKEREDSEGFEFTVPAEELDRRLKGAEQEIRQRFQ